MKEPELPAWAHLKELYEYDGGWKAPLNPTYEILMDFEKRLQALEDEYKLRLAMMEQRLNNYGSPNT